MSEPYRDDARTCVRCNVAVVPVTVVDHTEGAVYVGLVYTKETPNTSMWTGALANPTGVLRAHVCPRCQLVAWYAHPGEVEKM
jgi:hypothetical protein